jgi:hypothetical protein
MRIGRVVEIAWAFEILDRIVIINNFFSSFCEASLSSVPDILGIHFFAISAVKILVCPVPVCRNKINIFLVANF